MKPALTLGTRIGFSVGIVVFASLATIAWGQTRPIRESDFSRAAECGKCHVEIYRQWKNSAHARSFTDPVFRAVFEKMIEQTGRRNQVQCLSCHAPVASVAGTTLNRSAPLDWEAFSPIAAEGVTCDYCHIVAANENLGKKILVGQLRISRSGDDPVRFGRHRDAFTPAHPTKPSEFLTNSEFCGTCHQFKHPVLAEEVQNTFEEWRASSYSQRGVRCQDCHMPSFAGRTAINGRHRSDVHAHSFKGGHTELIRGALSMRLDGAVLQGGEEGRILEVRTQVRNENAGHSLPTGVPGTRELRLEVEVSNAAGDSLGKASFSYGQRLIGEDGKEALPWEAYRLVEDTRIAPRRSQENSFEVLLPEDVEGTLVIEGKIFFRLLSSSLSRRLGLPEQEARMIASQKRLITVR